MRELEKDILLDENDDLQIVDGDFAIGESLTQEVGIILRLSQGELKSSPILGANLIQLIGQEKEKKELQTRAKKHLALDEKDWDEVKNKINMNAKIL